MLNPPNRFGSNPNYTEFEADGTAVAKGNATCFRDELTDAVSLQQTGAGVSRNSTESVVEFTIGSNLSDYMFTNVQLNHDRKLTTTIYPHIHYFQAENNIPNFMLEYRRQKQGDPKVTARTQIKCNTNAHTYVSGTIHNIAYSTGISAPTGDDVSDIVQFRVLRDNANTSTLFTGVDPYTTTVGVLAFDVHIEIDMLGSHTEYSK